MRGDGFLVSFIKSVRNGKGKEVGGLYYYAFPPLLGGTYSLL